MIGITQIIFRLFFAAVLGGIVGFERELFDKAAGFRTHILVCVGSCLIMLLSLYMFDIYGGISNIDPSRIASQAPWRACSQAAKKLAGTGRRSSAVTARPLPYSQKTGCRPPTYP